MVLPLEENVKIETVEKRLLQRGRQDVLLRDGAEDQKIDQRPERLDQIVSQIKGVQRAAMMDPQRRLEAVYSQRSRDAAAQDRIAVIQPRVDAGIIRPGKAGSECSCTVRKQATENKR